MSDDTVIFGVRYILSIALFYFIFLQHNREQAFNEKAKALLFYCLIYVFKIVLRVREKKNCS